MKTMYTNAFDQVEFRDIGKPVRQRGEVLLKLLYGGICGSDPDSYRGTFAYFDYPETPGHELSVEIMEVDEDNGQGLHPGMIVTCSPYFSYGHYYSCEYGIVNTCINSQTMGCQRDGAFQEYITTPEEHVYDGKGLDPMLLTAIEPFYISYHGVSRAEIKPGDKVLVIGAGTIDVLAAAATKAERAMIYVSDVSMGKLDMTREFDVDGIILDDSPGGLDKAVKGITDENGFNIAIEAVGLSPAFQNCIDAACSGGEVVVIGVGKKDLDFNSTLFQRKELNVFGSRSALKKGFVELIGLVKEGKVLVKGIITNVCKFEDGVKTFNDFANNPGSMLKVILDLTDG